jgi:hypothetical protein
MGATHRHRLRWYVATGGVLLLAVGYAVYCVADPHASLSPVTRDPKRDISDFGRASDLPLPSSGSVADYEAKLFPFLNERRYADLGWICDDEIRDTGPYSKGKYHGTHPAVRVYYSPGAMRWLKNGRVGKIADGEMIIKEQYPAPAARHRGKSSEPSFESLEAWTVMIKDSAGSHDGWFWSNPARDQCVVDNHRYPFTQPISGFGLYCIRCHASTHSPEQPAGHENNEFTFASLRNIAAFGGRPLVFPVDDSWRRIKDETKPNPAVPVDLQRSPHGRCVAPRTAVIPHRAVDPAFVDFFRSIPVTPLKAIVAIPPVTHDWVVNGRNRTQEFVTSNQCMSCHAGLVAPFGPSMFVPTGDDAEYGAAGWDVSPYGEWRWTPMGLAGRDPIFYAQVESELALLERSGDEPESIRKLGASLTDTCLRCHGAMGTRQFAMDHPKGAGFGLADVHSTAGPREHIGLGDSKYGALARDGVSCSVCHRMQPRPQPAGDPRSALQFFLETSITGNFHLGDKGEIYGPFQDQDLSPYAMEHGTGLKPRHSDYLQSSRLCGTCHTVALPALDRPRDDHAAAHASDDLLRCQNTPCLQQFEQHVEQATYLEWLNSEYENEIDKQNPHGKSCQDCHMSRGLQDPKHGIDIPQLQSRIAAIQDATYPDAENLAAPNELNVRVRDKGYKRHGFAGLNVFLLEMFAQFDDILGVPKDDFMTGSKQGIEHAVENLVRTARDDVASVDVTAQLRSNRLTARVVVQNKVGHRFPSGVGFRRAFLELAIVEVSRNPKEADRTVWISGGTNELGVLVGFDGQPLATEFFTRDPQFGRQQYQKHHRVITTPDQVRIYERLSRDAAGDFTTSFVRGSTVVKDNRLLPRGWKRDGPSSELTGSFLKSTHPDPDTASDPHYADGSGSDQVTYSVELPGDIDPARLRVRATLYYQAVPPYYLRNLFETAPDAPATRRLHYLCSHVNLRGTPVEGWKLRIATAACDVRQDR